MVIQVPDLHHTSLVHQDDFSKHDLISTNGNIVDPMHRSGEGTWI